MSYKIDRVSETKRGRFALFADGEFLFSVDAETLTKQQIKEGSSLSSEELYSLKQESDTRKAKDQALRYLSLRAYGEQELYKKLCQKYDEFSASAAIASMRELAYLDDETFAADKARGLSSRGKSSTEIYRKLVELGIDRDLASYCAGEYADGDIQAACKLIEKMYLQKLKQGETQKVMAALARRGFTHRTIKAALEKISSEWELEEPEQAWDE